jgi:tRNA-binding EMAP/Myf-like protein
MIIDITRAVVGEVRCVQPHPNGAAIWLADVSLGKNAPVRIVYGGDRRLTGGELVPVALPGSRVTERSNCGARRSKTMRPRCYRSEWSHGMLCSLSELGWIRYGPNEVAILRDVTPGQIIDYFPAYRRPQIVVGWERAASMDQKARATSVLDLPALPWTRHGTVHDGQQPNMVTFGC